MRRFPVRVSSHKRDMVSSNTAGICQGIDRLFSSFSDRTIRMHYFHKYEKRMCRGQIHQNDVWKIDLNVDIKANAPC